MYKEDQNTELKVELTKNKTRANDIINKMINDNALTQVGTGKNIYYVLK